MCRFGTAMAAMETAIRQEDDRTLFMIEAALQYVVALDEEADRYGLDLKEFLQVVRSTYLATARK